MPEPPARGERYVGDPTDGLTCPVCSCRHFYTTNTYRVGNTMVRRRQCRHCRHPIKTTEILTSELEILRKKASRNGTSPHG